MNYGGIIGVAASRNARFSAFTECLANLDRPDGWEVMIKTGIEIGINRRNIVTRALEDDYEWVFFVDDDMVFPSNHLLKLLAHDLPVVASLYLNRTPPYGVMAYNSSEVINGLRMWKPVTLAGAPATGVAQIVAAGTAGMLVHTNVFKKIEYGTWFEHPNSTDDLAFSQRVIEAMFPIHLDLDARMGHISLHEVWPVYNEEWYVGLQLSETECLNVRLAP